MHCFSLTNGQITKQGKWLVGSFFYAKWMAWNMCTNKRSSGYDGEREHWSVQHQKWLGNLLDRKWCQRNMYILHPLETLNSSICLLIVENGFVFIVFHAMDRHYVCSMKDLILLERYGYWWFWSHSCRIMFYVHICMNVRWGIIQLDELLLHQKENLVSNNLLPSDGQSEKSSKFIHDSWKPSMNIIFLFWISFWSFRLTRTCQYLEDKNIFLYAWTICDKICYKR